MNPFPSYALPADEPAFSSAVRADDGVNSSVAVRLAKLERENAELREQLRRVGGAATGLVAAREKAEAADRVKGEFLANVSHEIRTAMGGIMGLAGLLLESPLNDEQRDSVQTVCRSGDGLLMILNDLLDFSKIEAGCLKLESTDFNLREELQLAFELQAAQAARKGLELILELDPALPAAVRGDPLRLRQVVLNLLGNAVKFTERGEVVLRVCYEPTQLGKLHCEIVDTGIGISLAGQAALFQPFVQAEVSRARRFGGTGLGLAICKRLVELMQGEIGVRSVPGVGSTFWFTAQMDPVAALPVPAALAPVSLHGLSVLIVDDNATNRHLLEHFCADWNMKYDVADSASMALAQLRWAEQKGMRYDLVMLDHLMPGMDGLELSRIINVDQEISRPALVMLTSRGTCPPMRELAACGIAACEQKPIYPEKLRRTLERAVAQRRSTVPSVEDPRIGRS